MSRDIFSVHAERYLRNRALERQPARSLALVLLPLLRRARRLLLLLARRFRLSSRLRLTRSNHTARCSTINLLLLRLLLSSGTALQSCELDLGNGLVEGLALLVGDLELLGSRLAGAVGVLELGVLVSSKSA